MQIKAYLVRYVPTLILSALLLTVSLPAQPAEETSDTYTSSDSGTDDFSTVARKDDLRLMSTIAYQDTYGSGAIGWRGQFEYMVDSWFGFTGTAHLSGDTYRDISRQFLALGMNIHIIQLENISIFPSASAGFTIADSPVVQNTQILPTIEMGIGAIYYGEFLCYSLEAGYRLLRFAPGGAGGINVPMNGWTYSVGIGIKL